MAFVHRLRQRIGDPGANAGHRRLLHAELHGDGVGGLEPNAVDVARKAGAVPTPWLCRKTMISRTTFCSAQAAVMRLARMGPMPSTSCRRWGSASMTSNTFSPN